MFPGVGVIKQHKPEQVTGVIWALICFSSVNLVLTFRARGQGKAAASAAGKRSSARLKCTVLKACEVCHSNKRNDSCVKPPLQLRTLSQFLYKRGKQEVL